MSELPEGPRARRIVPRLAIGQPAAAQEPLAPSPAGASPVSFRLCVITDDQGDAERLLAILAAALAEAPPGAVAVQLRERSLSVAALYALAERARRLTAAAGAALLINDRLDVALAVGADGVHLPSHGLPVQSARRALTAAAARLLVSAACHSLPEAQMAVGGGADLVTFGPIWPTPSKPAGPLGPGQGRVQPVELETLAQATAAVPVPVFALGGVDDEERAAACAAVGARVACIRLVLQADAPGRTIRRLFERVLSPRNGA